MTTTPDPLVHAAPLAELTPAVLYALLRLRVDVFVVEQECAYPELDGRDLEAATLLLWTDDDEGVTATARVLQDPNGVVRIGRVVTAPRARGRGLAGDILRSAIELSGSAPIVLDAQAHLAGWYARFGFAVSGDEFQEDGIPHVPMRREAA
jgi:ElaA protein